MLLKSYLVGRFLLITFLLITLVWYTFQLPKKLPISRIEATSPALELVRAVKDCQIYLEKYRLFEQESLLEILLKNIGLAEEKIAKITSLAKTTEQTLPNFFSLIDSIRNSVQRQKELTSYLKEVHREEDLTKTAIANIGSLRIELEKLAGLSITLQQLFLMENERQSQVLAKTVQSSIIKLIFGLFIGFGLILISFVIDLILLKQRVKTQNEPSLSYPNRDVLLSFESNFHKVEDSLDDISERISLMAFNALLEAARAGDAGKGFQIVADELKQLADRLAKSTDEVKRLLAEIQRSFWVESKEK